MIIAVWASVNNKKSRTDIDPEKWLEREIKDEYTFFGDYCLEIGNFEWIFTDDIRDLLTRFRYFKEYKIPSFSLLFDDLPAYWIDAVEIMENSFALAVRERDN